MDAVYLHARKPADSRVVFYSALGPDAALEALPGDLREAVEPTEFQCLLPTLEDDLEPVTLSKVQDGVKYGDRRIAPGMWHMRGHSAPIGRALPALAEMAVAAPHQPGLRALTVLAKLAGTILQRGDFAAAASAGGDADKPTLLPFHPRWDERSIRTLAAAADLVPGTLLTARTVNLDEPVWAVTPRNFAVGFVSHAVAAAGADHAPRFELAERLPRSFWKIEPTPVVSVIRPENELEEGVPWGLQVEFRPVPGLGVAFSLEHLEERASARLFPDQITVDVLVALRLRMNDLARKLPPVHRAMNMADGKASLTRAELDTVLDHLPLLESEGCEITLPGLDALERLTARIRLVEQKDPDEQGRPWFEFQWSVAVANKELSTEEFDKLVNSKSPLVFLDRGAVLLSPKDREALAEFAARAGREGRKVSFFEALRLKLGGAAHLHGLALEQLDAGPRIDQVAEALQNAREIIPRELPGGFEGELRPYQARGHAWMYFLLDQGFGACLADDMGLGKTVQALAVMLDWRRNPERKRPILIVCPVSVLGNWRREIQRFAPELSVTLHHGKLRASTLEEFEAMLRETDIVLTSYNLLQRDRDVLTSPTFEGLVLDEAQNIKNPSTRQSQAARALRGKFRLVLTGTPLENRPLDLWSIMDFLNEGLLGSRTSFLQTLEHPIVRQRSRSTAGMLANLVRPFVLRRLKTDPEIVTDLPEKTEQVVVAAMSKEQAALYESVVRKGLEEVEHAREGMARRGAILTTLLRLKQVCNHPAHFLSDGSALPGRSGKLDLLTEMTEEALAEGDRCLVFTQFKEMGTLLKSHLEAQFGGKVLFLHGSIPQKDREEMVLEFQSATDESPKIFVLSLKAGGTGLNLTAANRVFHFDRWWNPAVEDQATDRAFRIGQLRNVFVHKFVCNGTLEERIQTMLERKREVAATLLGAGEGWLTELTNEELRKLLVLDRQEALT